jgi:hypothetical protein
MFVAKNETTLSSTTQDVVEVALHASPSNKLDINQSNGSILLGKMRLLSRATIQGRGGSRFVEDLNGAGGVHRNMKSIRYKRGRSLRIIHDKESIYVNTARGRSLRVFMKEITTRILWHIASKFTQEKETT